jgi:hypothetical protein
MDVVLEKDSGGEPVWVEQELAEALERSAFLPLALQQLLAEERVKGMG